MYGTVSILIYLLIYLLGYILQSFTMLACTLEYHNLQTVIPYPGNNEDNAWAHLSKGITMWWPNKCLIFHGGSKLKGVKLNDLAICTYGLIWSSFIDIYFLCPCDMISCQTDLRKAHHSEHFSVSGRGAILRCFPILKINWGDHEFWHPITHGK